MAYYGLIPAAGSGSRIGGSLPKQYRPVAGHPLIRYSLDAFAAALEIECAYVVLSPDDVHFERLDLPPALSRRSPVLRVGGETRQESVLNGLDALQGLVHDDDWILVHDAARPGLTQALIARLIEALRNDPVGGLLALPVADTLKRESPGNRANRSGETLDRAGLWQAQTPQMFRYALLRRALREAVLQGSTVTDEASAIEALGFQPRLVIGSARNFKVTYPDDLELAGYMLSGMADQEVAP